MYNIECELTKDDWQYIEYATSQRFAKAKPQPGEPKTPLSPEFKKQEARIMNFLNKIAYSPKSPAV